jgi:DNA-binding transcriptional regulator YiaG
LNLDPISLVIAEKMSQHHAGQDWETVKWTKRPADSAGKEKPRPKPSRLDTDELPKPKIINQSLPQKLKDLRTKTQLGQVELAKKLSISGKLIGQWEQGKGCPTPQQYARINRLLSKTQA